MRLRVAKAFWTLKNLTTEQGQAKYGPHFTSHDEMVMAHACPSFDPRCDQAHFGPHFMTFHRAWLLKYELALLSVDPSIEAMPYWNMAYDSAYGKFRYDEELYFFSNNFIGSFYGTGPNHAVVDGLFAHWPVAEYTPQRFGRQSAMAEPQNRCIRQEYFRPKKARVCDRCCLAKDGDCNCTESDNYTAYLRNHDDCTPWVTRNPRDRSGQVLALDNGTMLAPQGLGGSFEILYTEDDFERCSNPVLTPTWEAWQNCVELSRVGCEGRWESEWADEEDEWDDWDEDGSEGEGEDEDGEENEAGDDVELRGRLEEEDAADARASFLERVRASLAVRVRGHSDSAARSDKEPVIRLVERLIEANPRRRCSSKQPYMVEGSYRTKEGGTEHVHTQTQARLKFGGDLLDIATSPNDIAAFTGYHADIDRNNFHWMMALPEESRQQSWTYPRKGGTSEAGSVSGPGGAYAFEACGCNHSTFSEYFAGLGKPSWLAGTTLDEVVNEGLPFFNLFRCGMPGDCLGGRDGYTHGDILYWTAPERTPYTYDTLEHIYYPGE